jgi:hypothetical protein
MRQLWRDHGLVPTCPSLVSDAVDGLPELAVAVDDELEEACARWRFPRPALVVEVC